MYFRKEIISPKGLQNIATHTYKAGTYSILDNYLNYWWNYIVEWMPLWLAPNVITLIGAFFVLSTIPFGLYFSTTSIKTVCQSFTTLGDNGTTNNNVLCHEEEERSLLPIANLYIALGVFMHQTLDAIDGKQARRTGSSSPLGQLFDHGCDALVACAISWNVCEAMGLSSSREAFLLFTSILFAFFLAQWDEYHSHQLSTHVGGIGITEGQVALMIFHSIAAFLPNTVWSTLHEVGTVSSTLASIFQILEIGDTKLSSTGSNEYIFSISIGQFLTYNAILIIGFIAVFLVYRVIFQLQHPESIKHLVGPLIVLFTGLFFIIEPFRSLFLTLSNIGDKDSVRTTVADTHTELLFLLYSLNITYMTTQVIVCSMTQEIFPFWQIPAFLFPILLYIAYTPSLQIYTYYSLFIYLVFIITVYIRYVYTSMNQITTRLGIRAFIIPSKVSKSTTSSMVTGQPTSENPISDSTTKGISSSSTKTKNQRKSSSTPSKRKSN